MPLYTTGAMSAGLAGVVPTQLLQLGKNQQAWKRDTRRDAIIDSNRSSSSNESK